MEGRRRVASRCCALEMWSHRRYRLVGRAWLARRVRSRAAILFVFRVGKRIRLSNIMHFDIEKSGGVVV